MPFPQITQSRAFQIGEAATAMRAVEPGETIAYAALDDAIGEDSRKVRHVIEAARDNLRREGYVFVAEPTVGYRRLSEAEIATTIPAMRNRRIQHQAKTGLGELAAIRNPAALSQDLRIRYAVGGAVLGAMLCVAGAKARKVLSDIASQHETPSLPIEATLEALRNIG